MPRWFMSAVGVYLGLLSMISFALDGNVALANWCALMTAGNAMFYLRAIRTRKRGK